MSRFTAIRLVRLNVVRVVPPFDDLHVAPYPTTGAPFPEGGANETRSAPPATFWAVTPFGAGGAPMTIGAVGADAVHIPPPFAAATVNVTDEPSVNP